MIDVLAALILIAGSVLIAIAAIGLIRMPDVFNRMHAATKAGTLGTGLILAAVAIASADVGVAFRAMLAIVFLFITAPVAAHLIGRTAYRTGVPIWQGSVIDEWGQRGEKSPTTEHPSNKRRQT